MMRTILFVNFLQETRQLRSIVKQIPYAPEDSEMYFIDISTADKEKLGVDALSYLNNHYEDDAPCVWLMQPSHIASIHMPVKYMRLQLLLAMLRQGGVSYRVASFSGGQAKNAIPAFGTATVVLSAAEEDRAKAIIETFRGEFAEAFGNIEPDMVFTTTFGDTAPDRVLTGEVGYGMVGLMTTVPNNVHTMSPFIDGLVESSANLGVVSVDEDMVRFTVFARSSVAYHATQIGVICGALANSFGFTFDSEGHVPGWAVNPNSKLTHIACDAYKHLTGTDMIVEPVHAGVECGAFAEKNPHLDMISIGPTLVDVHTPNEVCKIEDVKITTELLIEILERIAK